MPISNSSRPVISRLMMSVTPFAFFGGLTDFMNFSNSTRCISPASKMLLSLTVTNRRVRFSRAPSHSGHAYSTMTFLRYESTQSLVLPCLRYQR